MSASFQRAVDHYEKLSPREQRLAIIVGGLVAIFLVFLIVRGAFDTLATLDAQVNRLQQNILNVDNQIRHRASIEQQYARVASQHSSKWSAAEIHDRLRAEIYRLAQMQPPSLNAEGVPEKVTNSMGELVTIPTLQQGNLTEGEQGYREYTLSFSVPPAPLQNMLNFIDRLQNSPQSLRVDVIEMTRDPLDEQVSANLTITRTVVAGVVEDKNASKAAPVAAKVAGAKPAAKPVHLNPGEWKAEVCKVDTAGSGNEVSSITFTPTGPDAQVYVERSLPAAAYEVTLDVSAEGPTRLVVEDGGKELEGGIDLPTTGKAISVKFQFRPASSGRPQLRFPVLKMSDPKSIVRVTRMSLEKVGE